MIFGYALVLNEYLWCSYSLVLNFILKIFICLFFHNFFFFFILIKSDKQDDTTNLFNKWIVLGLRNLDPFNKHIGLVLTYIVGYSWVDTTRTRHVNMNYHPYFSPSSFLFFSHPPFATKHDVSILLKQWWLEENNGWGSM